MVVTTHNDSLLEKPIAWLWPARLLAALHQHQHKTFHVTKFLFDDEGVPIALPPPPPDGVCPSTCPPSQNSLDEALERMNPEVGTADGQGVRRSHRRRRAPVKLDL